MTWRAAVARHLREALICVDGIVDDGAAIRLAREHLRAAADAVPPPRVDTSWPGEGFVEEEAAE